MESKDITNLNLQELKKIEQKLFQVRDRITIKIREDYLETKKSIIFSLFEKGVIDTSDFKQKNRWARRIIAKRFMLELLYTNINISDLFYHENLLLKSLAKNLYTWLNGYEMMKESKAFMKWLGTLWESFQQQEKSPPGGPSLILNSSQKKTPSYKYFQVRVLDTDCDFCSCFCGEVPEKVYIVRSDFTGSELHDILYFSQAFGLTLGNYKRIRSLSYKGKRLNRDDSFIFSKVEDNALIMASFDVGEPPDSLRSLPSMSEEKREE